MFAAILSDEDREFIAELYNSKYRTWFKAAYDLTHDTHTSEDIVNDVFVKLLRKIDVLREMECYKANAYVIISIRNTCKRYLSNKSKEGHPVDFYNDDNMAKLKSDFNTEKAVLDKLDLETVRKVLCQLSETERDFLINSFLEGHSDKEIAKQTGMKYNNIRTYRCRLKNKLRKLCSEESEEKSHG